MRKIAMMTIVSAAALMAIGGGARASDIVGTWMGVGAAATGGQYATTLRFFPNGSFQYQMMTAGPQGSGGFYCQGAYRFDGQTLETHAAGCSTDGPPPFNTVPPQLWPTWAGPAMFSDAYTFKWGDTTFRRQ